MGIINTFSLIIDKILRYLSVQCGKLIYVYIVKRFLPSSYYCLHFVDNNTEAQRGI